MNNQRRSYIPKRSFQYIAMVTVCLNTFTSGMHYSWSSPSLMKLPQNAMTDSEASWVVVMIYFGVLCGSSSAGFLLDRLGRKNVILLAAVPFAVSWAMIAYKQTFWVLIVARFLAGISDGLSFCSIPMYLAEISDPEIRGFLAYSPLVTSSLGNIMMNLTGSYLSINLAALINLSFPIILLLTFVWIPESAYCLIMKGKRRKAKQSLRTFKQESVVEVEFTRICKAVAEQNRNTGKYLDLFTVESNRKALLILFGIRALNQLSGLAAFLFYTQTIFQQAGDSISPTLASMIYFVVQTVVCILSSLVVDKLGRRPLTIISSAGVCVTLLMQGCLFYIKSYYTGGSEVLNILPVATFIGFIVFFNISLQTIPNVLVGELFPTNVKAFAFSLHDVYFCILGTVVSKLFQYTSDNFGIHVPFFIFTACSVLGLIFIIIFLPETKGKTLEEIQELLQKKTRAIQAESHESIQLKPAMEKS